MSRFLILVLIVFALLVAGVPVSAQENDWQTQIEFYRDATIAKAREGRLAKQEWMAKPTPAAQAKFNKLSDEAHRLYKHLQSMEAAVKESERVNNPWLIAVETSMHSIEDMGGYISDASTRLFGASDEELYGPNWQTINAQYDAMSEKYRAILERKKVALAKPDNDVEVNALIAEVTVMRKKYEVLRQMVRMEQRNLGSGIAITLWGEEGLGRHIKAITENLDVSTAIADIIWANPKLIYTVFKPGIMLQIGEKYISPKGNLTPQIADAIVIDVMGLGPGKVMSEATVKACEDNYLQDVAKNAADAGMQLLQEKLAKSGNQQFQLIEKAVMKPVKERLQRNLEWAMWDIIKKLPYEKFPSGTPAQFGALVDQAIQAGPMRAKLFELAEKEMAESLKLVASAKRAGFVRNAMKPAATGRLLEGSTYGMDIAIECINLFATAPSTCVVLETANTEAGQIRKQYRELVAKKLIDQYEQTEDEYLNAMWGKKWRYLTPKGPKAMSDALVDVVKAKDARTGLIDQAKKTDALLKMMTPTKAGDPPPVGEVFVDPLDAAALYTKTMDGLERQFDAGTITPRELVRAEADAYQVGAEGLNTLRGFNAKVHEAKLAHIDLVYQPKYQQAREAAGALAKSSGYVDNSTGMVWKAEGLTVTQWNALPVAERQNREARFNAFKGQVAALMQKADNIVFKEWRPAQDAETKAYQQTIPPISTEEHDLATARETRLTQWAARAKAVLLKLQPYVKADDDLQAKATASVLATPPAQQANVKIAVATRTKAEDDWRTLQTALQSAPRAKADTKFDTASVIATVRAIAEADETLQRELPVLGERARAFTDDMLKSYEDLVENAAIAVENDGQWGELAFEDIVFSRLNQNADAMNGMLSPDAIHRRLLDHGHEALYCAENWLKSADNLLGDQRDPTVLRTWCDRVQQYGAAQPEIRKLQAAILSANTALKGVLYTNGAINIFDGEEHAVPQDKLLLAQLSAKASSSPADEYRPPTVQTAAWLIRAIKVTTAEIQALYKRCIPAEAIRLNMGEYETALETAIEKGPAMQYNMSDGYAALTDEAFPGFGALASIPKPETLTVPDTLAIYRTNRHLLRRIANLEKFLSELPAASQKVEKAQATYLGSLKAWHTAVLKIYSDAFTAIEGQLDRKQWKEAKTALDAITGKLPAYPSIPDGAIAEGTSVEALGFADAYAKNTARRQAIERKITELERAEAEAGTQSTAEAKIRELYQAFKSAYETRNEMKVLSYLADTWTAGDGTDIDDIGKTLRNAFTMYDQVRFTPGALTIVKITAGTYRVTYDVTITGRIFENDLKHEEKSTVTEEVVIDEKGKARIQRTVNGRFWYVE